MNHSDGTTCLLRRIPRECLAAFISTFVLGYAVHLFAFTNIIPNMDGLSRVYENRFFAFSGRWFLQAAGIFNGHTQAPALIGFFSLVFMGIAAALLVRIFRIRRPLFAALTGAFMIICTPAAYTYLFMYTASAYFFGLLLAVAAVACTVKWKKAGWIAGIVLLALATGTYQAYFAAALAAMAAYLILETLRRETSGKEVFFRALRFLLTAAAGFVLYLVLTKLFLVIKGQELFSYRDMNLFGSLSAGGFLHSAAHAYKDFLKWFFVPGSSTSSYPTPVIAVLNWILAVLAVIAFVYLLKKEKGVRTPGKAVLLIIFCLVFPFTCNFFEALSDSSVIMRFSMIFVYLLAVSLLGRAADPADATSSAEPVSVPEPSPDRQDAPVPGRSLSKSRVFPGIFVLFSIVLLICLAQFDNICYTGAATAHRAAQSFATTLVTRVESMPGYKNGMDVIIVGRLPQNIYYNDVEPLADINDITSPANTVLHLNKHIYYYLNDWLNVQWEEPSQETLQEVSDSAEFRAMPFYPDDGSIVISGGRVIVRLSEKHIPKQDFELIYESAD